MSFLRAFLAGVLGIALVYLGVVVAVNSRLEFGEQRLPPVDANSRLQKMRLFEDYDAAAPVRGVILGSSRSMKLDPMAFERLTGRRFFNFAVLAGVTDDYLALYHYLKRRPHTPELWIIGLDISSLGGRADLAYDMQHNVELQSSLTDRSPGAFDRARFAARLLQRAFTISYLLDTKRSIEVALHPVLPRYEWTENGSLRNPLWESQIAAGTYNRLDRIATCARFNRAVFRNNDSLSTKRIHQLETLISEIRADGATAVLWLTPFHPSALDSIRAQPRARANFERASGYFRDFARRAERPVVDFTRVEAFGGAASQWFDCTHYDSTDAQRIAVRLAQELRAVESALAQGR